MKTLLVLISLFAFNFAQANTEATSHKTAAPAHGEGKAKHDPGSLFPQPKQNKDKSITIYKLSLKRSTKTIHKLFNPKIKKIKLVELNSTLKCSKKKKYLSNK
jgi:hypothetical protein